MNGGVMRSKQMAVAAASGPPITTFAALPPVGSVPGQLRQLSDAGNIIVQARDIWRPYGGSQVLAMRSANPVTIQNLSGQVAETIGPFPGGLVRTNMRLEVDCSLTHSGIGTATRIYRVLLDNSIPITATNSLKTLIGFTMSGSGSSLAAHVAAIASIGSDAAAGHLTALFGGAYTVGGTSSPIDVDFSLPWYMQIQMVSAAETAVNIASASWAAGVATFNTSAPSTLVTGDKTVIASVSPAGWNIAAGAIVTRIDDDTFTVPMAADPGAYVSGGTSSRVSNMKSQSYVLTLKG